MGSATIQKAIEWGEPDALRIVERRGVFALRFFVEWKESYGCDNLKNRVFSSRGTTGFHSAYQSIALKGTC